MWGLVDQENFLTQPLLDGLNYQKETLLWQMPQLILKIISDTSFESAIRIFSVSKDL